MTYLINITSFEELKSVYRKKAMELHPDMGGSVEAMQELNNEYDALFPIWKNRQEMSSKTTINETADGDRNTFYTANGWAGDNYSSRRSTKDIANIIRTYLKEKYSEYKWSVTVDGGTWTSDIRVLLMEAPYNVFADGQIRQHNINQYHVEKEEALTPKAKAMFIDVIQMINSYRYDDSDGMIDYFDTNFYYSVGVGKWDKSFKVVHREPKKPDDRVYETVVVKETKKRTVRKTEDIAAPDVYELGQHFQLKTGFTYGHYSGRVYQITSVNNGRIVAMKMGRKLDKPVTSTLQRGNCFTMDEEKFRKYVNSQAIAFVKIVEEIETYEVEKTVKRPVKPEYNVDTALDLGKYTINEDVDTRDNSKIWVVRFAERVDMESFNAIRDKIKTIGGYYSRFKKGFLFRENPAENMNRMFA